MGFRVCWLAARGKPAEAFRDELGLSEMEPIEGDFLFEQPFAGAVLYRGWYGVFVNDGYSKFLDDGSLSKLSRGAEVLACTVNETVMDCSAQLWRGGSRVWLVRHDAQQSLNHLEVSGRPDSVRVERLKKQALDRSGRDVDPPDYMFEVPVLMAFLEAGFKHDRIFRKSPIFHELGNTRSPGNEASASTSQSKPFWKFW